MTYTETTFGVRKQKLKLKRCNSFIMLLLLTSIYHCNINLSTITPMLQHTGIEIFDHSSQCGSII